MKNITLFSGGRGNAELFATMKHNMDNIKLSVIINGLDDGSSTGEIRKLFKYNALGISDFLKVILSLSKDENLICALDSRFPKVENIYEKIELTHDLYLLRHESIYPEFLLNVKKVNKKHQDLINASIFSFLEYFYKINDQMPDIEDFKVGNIIFADMLIKNTMNFNKTITSFSKFCGIDTNNISIISNTNDIRYLVGVLKNGVLLPNEAAVVLTRTTEYIRKTFQISMPLNMNQIRKLCSVEIDEKQNMLRNISHAPIINKQSKRAIVTSQLIVYGSGTPHSSILPSLETKGMCELVMQANCPKVLIANLKKESSNYMAISYLIKDIFQYFQSSFEGKRIDCVERDLLTHLIVSDNILDDDDDAIHCDEANIIRDYPWIKIIKSNISKKDNIYRHDGNKILDILLSI